MACLAAIKCPVPGVDLALGSFRAVSRHGRIRAGLCLGICPVGPKRRSRRGSLASRRHGIARRDRGVDDGLGFLARIRRFGQPRTGCIHCCIESPGHGLDGPKTRGMLAHLAGRESSLRLALFGSGPMAHRGVVWCAGRPLRGRSHAMEGHASHARDASADGDLRPH